MRGYECSAYPRTTSPAATRGAADLQPSHVVLAACRIDELAREQRIDGHVRGVFSHALLGALQTLEPTASYRELLATARADVANLASGQLPHRRRERADAPVRGRRRRAAR